MISVTNYEFYYRSNVSATAELPLVPAQLTFANPAHSGASVLATAVPTEASVTLVDGVGRVLLSQKLVDGQSFTLQQYLSAGHYLIAVAALGFHTRGWPVVVLE